MLILLFKTVLLLSWESHHWGRFTFQLISNLGVPLLGAPAGNWAIYASVGKVMVFFAWVIILCNQVGCLVTFITIA